MRRLAPAFVLLFVLGGAPGVLAGDLPASGEIEAFLAEESPEVRLGRAFAIVGQQPDVVALGTAVAKGWRWDAAAVKGEPVSWTLTTDDGVVHTVFGYAPPSYTPEKAWPLLLWMHGGVARDEDGGGRGAVERLRAEAEAKGFLVLAPSTQKDAMWWTPRGVALLREALAGMKRRYRVDANRVAAVGFSDGGSACFHLLAHDPEPYCCFLSFVGNPLATRLMGGPTWGPNVATRPIYAVNGGRDQLFPSGALAPYFRDLQGRGADLTWIDEPELGHEFTLFEKRWEEAYAFWVAHPRDPLPRKTSWTTSRPDGEGRFGWVEITELSGAARRAEGLERAVELDVPDLRRPRLGIRLTRDFAGPGLLLEDVEEDTPADGVFETGDVILKAGETEFLSAEDLPALREYLNDLGEEDGVFLVKRGDAEVELSARPEILPKDAPARPEALGFGTTPGTIVVEVGDGNVIDVKTFGVRHFRLHLSPALVDFSKPVTVRINGEDTPLYAGPAPRSAAYVLAQAVRQGPGAPVTIGVVEGEVSEPRAVGPGR